MAYFSQEMKKAIQPMIKELCNRFGVKASLSVLHHSKVVLNIKEGKIDFGGEYIQVNPYNLKDYEGAALAFLEAASSILNRGNWDESDSMTDYFNVGHYVRINIGKWDKPYSLQQ